MMISLSRTSPLCHNEALFPHRSVGSYNSFRNPKRPKGKTIECNRVFHHMLLESKDWLDVNQFTGVREAVCGSTYVMSDFLTFADSRVVIRSRGASNADHPNSLSEINARPCP